MKRRNRKICMVLFVAVLLTGLENTAPVCASSEMLEEAAGKEQNVIRESSSAIGAVNQGETDETEKIQGTESSEKIAIEDVTAGKIPDQPYTGKEIMPDIQLTYGGEELVRDRDYVLEYQNHVNAGTAVINISGIGNYTGTRTEEFRIAQADISHADAVLDTDSCIYTGRECQVGIVLKHNGMTLVQGTDYTVQYQNHVNAGTAVIKVTGQNNYTGSFTKTFKITSRDASDVKITPVASQTYTGRAVTPSLRIIYDGKELVQGRDYTVVCKNNVRLGKGTAKAEIRFQGNFKGRRSIRFSIVPASPVLNAKASSDTVKLKWKKAEKADGYRIYRRNRDNKEWIYLGETTDLRFTDKNRKQDTAYSYAVRAFIKQKGKRFYSRYQKIKTVTKKNKKLLSCKMTEASVLREKPTSSGKKIRSLSKGETVKIVRGYTKRKNGCIWYKVKNGKGYGYVVSKALEKKESFSVKSNVEFQMSADRRSGINAALQRFRNRGQGIAFVMWDCRTDAVFCYNRDRRFFTASAIKAPYIAFVMQNYVETGRAGMKGTKFNRNSYAHQGGTGTIKNDGAGTVYTLEEVIKRTIRKSDNMGYTMLRRRFGTESYKNWLRKAGVRTSANTPDYPDLSAMEFAKMWKYTYGYLKKQTKYSRWLEKEYANSGYSFLRPAYKGKYKVCSKPGMVAGIYNEAGIVMSGEHPYVLAVLSTASGWQSGWQSPAIKRDNAAMAELVSQVDALHDEYIKAIQ